MTLTALVVLLLLQVKHLLFDFVLQTPYQSKNKGIYGHPGGVLHSGLHVLGTSFVLGVFGVAPLLLTAMVVGEFLVHYHTDWLKEQVAARYSHLRGPGFWSIFGLDQLVHQATYVLIVFVVWGSS